MMMASPHSSVSSSVSQKGLVLSTRLVGRDAELHQLQEMYYIIRDGHESDDESGLSRSIFLSGPSGVGKTKLVRQALSNLGAYFCEGKFDLMKTHEPFSALVQALGDLSRKAFAKRNDPQNRAANQQLREEVGRLLEDNEAVLSGVFPNLSKFLKLDLSGSDDNSSTVSNLSGSVMTPQQSLKHAVAKFYDCLRSLIGMLMGPTSILILFIDDLQWAGVESLDLLQDLVTKMPRLLLVGGIRTEEKDVMISSSIRDHPLFRDIYPQESSPSFGSPTNSANLMAIQPLKLEDVMEYLVDTLKRSDVQGLAELVFERTEGNMFHIQRYLEVLHGNGHLYYSIQDLQWEWEDLATIQDVDEPDLGVVIEQKIMRLPAHCIDVVKVAACMGGRFDLELLQLLLNKWPNYNEQASARRLAVAPDLPLEEILWPAVEEGILEELGSDPLALSIQYKFSHDKVQSAAYDLLGKEHETYHLVIGSFFRDHYEESNGPSWMIIQAADHLCRALPLLQSQTERDAAAKVIYLSAQELHANSAFHSSAAQLRKALSLIGRDGWNRTYQLTLDITNLIAESELCAGLTKDCEVRAKTVLEHAKTLQEKQNAYYIWMVSLSSENRVDEAMEIGIRLLRQMKVSHIPKRITARHVLLELVSTHRLVQRHSEEDLYSKPHTEDENVRNYLRALMSMIVFAWPTSKKLQFLFFSLRSVKISLLKGCSACSSPSFAACAVVYGTLSRFLDCHKLGRAGMELARRFDAPDAASLTMFIYYATANHLYTPCPNLSATYTQITRIGFDSGNVLVGCTSRWTEVHYAWLEGSVRLDRLASLAAVCCEEQQTYNILFFATTSRMLRQITLNMLSRNPNPSVLEGDEIENYDDFIREYQDDATTQRRAVWMSMQAAFWHGDLDRAHKFAVLNASQWKSDYPIWSAIFTPFIRCLIWCQMYARDGKPKFRRLAKKELKLMEGWVKQGLANRDWFCSFMRAEIAVWIDGPRSGSGDATAADNAVKDAYDNAIAAASSSGYSNFAALGAERAGTYFAMKYRKSDTESLFAFQLSRDYLQEALERYRRWRAISMVRRMKSNFRDILDGTSMLDSCALSVESSFLKNDGSLSSTRRSL